MKRILSRVGTAPGVEKRANAFAAMLLMPRMLLRRVLPHGVATQEDVVSAALALKVSPSTLVEHLYDTFVIDAVMRDSFRSTARMM